MEKLSIDDTSFLIGDVYGSAVLLKHSSCIVLDVLDTSIATGVVSTQVMKVARFMIGFMGEI